MSPTLRWSAWVCALSVGTGLVAASPAAAATTATILLRGRPQTLHLYGVRGGPPVIVSSGDGGWLHLGPYVAELLEAKGFFVVGFDVKAYLASFTSGSQTLRREDEPSDYRSLAAFAGAGSDRKPILIGVSEGAGLSVLAASDSVTKASIAGVIGLGLPDRNELGWRWKDSLIYLTHGVPHEPTFSAADIAGRVAPVPLGIIHSTGDEFVSLVDARRIANAASAPSRLWVIDASDHRFSGNLPAFDRALMDALVWIATTNSR